MNVTMMFRAAFLSLLALVALASGAEAQVSLRLSPDDARQGVNGGRQLPLRDIVRTVRAQVPGELVDVIGLEQQGARLVYLLRWKTDDGRILTLTVDAETGAVQR